MLHQQPVEILQNATHLVHAVSATSQWFCSPEAVAGAFSSQCRGSSTADLICLPSSHNGHSTTCAAFSLPCKHTTSVPTQGPALGLSWAWKIHIVCVCPAFCHSDNSLKVAFQNNFSRLWNLEGASSPWLFPFSSPILFFIKVLSTTWSFFLYLFTVCILKVECKLLLVLLTNNLDV